MTLGSGIVSQIGCAQEVTPGTAVTPTHFFEFTSETLQLSRKIAQGGGLRPDKTFDRASRRVMVQRQAAGDITMNLPLKGLGLLLQNMVGSFATAPTQIASTTAYQQIHVPGSFTGKALTIQKGVPKSDGSGVEPLTYPGSKITGWQLDCPQSDICTLKLTVDSTDELTTASVPAGPALAAPSYPSGNGDFNFTEGALVQGGTVSVASGLASLTGGTAVATVQSVQLNGAVPVNNSRFFLGSQTKAEQIQNAYNTISGQMVVEFASRALYDQYRADGSAALQLTLTGPLIAGSNHFLLQILMPVAFLEDGVSPQIGGPDVVSVTIPFTGLDDNATVPFQIYYVSTDVTI